jgi:succinate dehydrogenase / fumarate reductase membrane anchor subunit
VQRATAIALIPLALWFLFSLLCMPGMGFDTVQGWVAAPLNAALLCLLVVCLCWHSQLGVQVVIEDYVPDRKLQALSLLLSVLAHVLLAGTGVFAILRTAMKV